MNPENGHQPEASDTSDTALYVASMADELARLEADQISKRRVGEKPPVAAGSD